METEKKFFSYDELFGVTLRLGDSAYWPWILMRDESTIKNLSCFLYYQEYKKLPECEDDIKSPEVLAFVETYVTNLRFLVQGLFNQLAPEQERKDAVDYAKAEARADYRKKQEEEIRLREAGKDFLKNNSVDYGGKTVSQLALELGISKAEVRRRKQNGEL